LKGKKMNTETGEILSFQQVAKLRKEFGGELPEHIKMMAVDPTPKQLKHGKVGRNDPCPCGSGNKFKKCCLATAAHERSNRQ